jgi:hypothetical protein
MIFYLISLSAIVILISATLIRFFLLKKKNIPVLLFTEALHNENCGQFEEAILSYENALEETRKKRFHGMLENRIIEKLRVLHTAIEYKNSFSYTR